MSIYRTFPMMMALLLVGACARGNIGAPSLAPRPAEKLSAVVPDPVVESPAIPADATLPERLRLLQEKADKAHSNFMAAESGTRTTVNAARSAAAGSEAWVAAQQAITRLDVSRTDARHALADLDSLTIALAEKNQDDLTAATSARDRIAGLVESEQRSIDSLVASLKAI